MPRQIYRISAWVIDSNGTYSEITVDPGIYDSRSYGNDPGKAYYRAEGKASEVWSEMCKADTRQVQTVLITDAKGFPLYTKTRGDFIESHPVQQPESGGGEE